MVQDLNEEELVELERKRKLSHDLPHAVDKLNEHRASVRVRVSVFAVTKPLRERKKNCKNMKNILNNVRRGLMVDVIRLTLVYSILEVDEPVPKAKSQLNLGTVTPARASGRRPSCRIQVHAGPGRSARRFKESRPRHPSISSMRRKDHFEIQTEDTASLPFTFLNPNRNWLFITEGYVLLCMA